MLVTMGEGSCGEDFWEMCSELAEEEMVPENPEPSPAGRQPRNFSLILQRIEPVHSPRHFRNEPSASRAWDISQGPAYGIGRPATRIGNERKENMSKMTLLHSGKRRSSPVSQAP